MFATPRARHGALGFPAHDRRPTRVGLIPPYLTKPLVEQRVHSAATRARRQRAIGLLLFGRTVRRRNRGLAVELGPACSSPPGSANASPPICAAAPTTHLQSLSLEFFGGKRTGDLMARVDTDTDRICVFLSVSLVDFVNDLVMIVMTVGLCC